MCDAAIALCGESGTTSEAMFSVSLERPVIFVGECWRDLCARLKDTGRQALRDEVDEAIRYVGQSEFVDKDQILDRVEKLSQLTFDCFDSPDTGRGHPVG